MLTILSLCGILYTKQNNTEQRKEKVLIMTYSIEKYNPKTDEWENMGGGYTENDVKQITKGFPFNGMFYTRKNSQIMYVVEKERLSSFCCTKKN